MKRMNLHWNDGTVTIFKQFVHRFELEDLNVFLAYVAEHQPKLLEEPEST